MSAAQNQRNALFSLRLDQGQGRLVLVDRTIAELLVIDEMRLSLAHLPSRLDMNGGVERFRHHRTHLDSLTVRIQDADLGRILRRQETDPLISNIEVRAVDGDLVFIGEVGAGLIPFLCRARLELANVGHDRALLFSFYELRIYGPCEISSPQLGSRLMTLLGLEDNLVGPTAAIFDPLDLILDEVCSELGWKMPDRAALRLSDVQCAAGQLRLVCDHQPTVRIGPRSVSSALDQSARARRFLADYEAKMLYANTERLVDDGQISRAVTHYDRQAELHHDNHFISTRLLQLQVLRPESLADAAATANRRLSRYADDVESLNALAIIHWQEGNQALAGEQFERIAILAERRGDGLEAAQARCAMATLLAPTEPKAALLALEAALGLRRRQPSALRALADLQARTGDWEAALRTRERLVAGVDDSNARADLLVELGQTALSQAENPEIASGYFERALSENAERVDALIGLAEAQDELSDFLGAVRTLDRAARLLQQRADVQSAADVIVRLGQLWTKEPGEGLATASLRFRQALTLVPGHAGALYGLADVAMAKGEIATARSALEELLRAYEEGRVDLDPKSLFVRLGAVLETDGGDAQLAIAYYQKALDGAGEASMKAFTALERIFSDAERWDDLSRLMQIGIVQIEDPIEMTRRLGVLVDVVVDHEGDTSRALELLELATEGTEPSLDLLERLARLYRESERHDALASTLKRLCARESEPLTLADYYTELGVLLRSRLNQVDQAAESFSKALGCHRDHLAAIDGLIDINRERERYGELSRLLERRADLADAEMAAHLLLELGQIQSGILKQNTKALHHLARAVSLDPSLTPAMRLLGDLYFDADRLDLALAQYEALHQAYERDGYDEPVEPFLMRQAEVMDGLGRTSDAIELIRAVVNRDPDRLDTYQQGQDIFLKMGSVEGLAEFLGYGLQNAVQPAAREYLTSRLGRILWRELRRPEAAEPLLEEASRYRPENGDVRRMRIEVATALSDWSKVSTLLNEELDSADESERPALMVRLAKLAYGELNRPHEGRQFAKAALGEQADYIPALTLLGEHAFQVQAWQDAFDAYSALERTESSHARLEDRFRLAVCQLNLGDAEQAFEGLRRVRSEGVYIPGLVDAYVEACLSTQSYGLLAAAIAELDPSESEHSQELLRVSARQLQDIPQYMDAARVAWARLVEHLDDDLEASQALETLSNATPDPLPGDEKSPDVTIPLPTEPLPRVTEGTAEVAVPDTLAVTNDELLRTQELSSLDHARISLDTAYEETLATLESTFDPEDDELPPLSGRNVPTELEVTEPVKAADALVQAIETSEGAQRAVLRLQLAELTRDRLHNPDGALVIFEQVLDDAEPGTHEWSEAMEALEDVRALRGEWDALLALYDRRIETGLEPSDQVELLKASVLRTCGRLNEARAAAEAALSVGDRALDLLIAILEDQGENEEAANVLVRDIDDLSKLERGHRLWRAADLCANTKVDRAIALMADASTCLQDAGFADEYVQQARRSDNESSLADALIYQASVVDTSPNADVKNSRRLFEAASLIRSNALDGHDLVQILNRCLELWPDNVEALGALRQVHEERGDADALVDVLAHELTLLLPGPRRRETAERLVELLEGAGEDSDRLTAAREIVQAEGEERSLNTLSGQVQANADEIVRDLLERGQTLMESGSRVEEIAEVLEEALGLDPAADSAYVQLAQLYRTLDMPEQLSAILERHAAAIGPQSLRASLWLERGRIAHERLDASEDALSAFTRAMSDESADDVTTRAALTEALLVEGSHTRFSKFLDALDRRVEQQPNNPAMLCLRAEFLESTMQQSARAESDHRAALEADCLYGPAVLAVARIEFDSGRIHQALNLYRRVLEDDVHPVDNRDRMVALVAASKCFQTLELLDELKDFALDVAVRYPEQAEIQRFVEDVAGSE